MSQKMHFLRSHLDFFPENNSDVSDKHRERFHQDIKTIEGLYQGKLSSAMIADFCWSLQRDTNEKHRRKRRCLQHFKSGITKLLINFFLRLTAVCVLCNLLLMSYLMFILRPNRKVR